MSDRQQRDARRVYAQRAWPEADQPKAARGEQAQLEVVPAAFGADREEHAIAVVRQRRTDRRRAARIGDESRPSSNEIVQVILDEDPELPVDRDRRQPRVASLLQPLDEERPVGRFGEDVRAEVVPFHAFGIGQDDLPHTKRRELRPETPHHLGARQREQHIDQGTWGSVGLEDAAHGDAAVTGILNGPDTERTVKASNSNGLARRHAEHV